MREHEDLEEQIRQFVAERLSVKPERLQTSVRLGDDLGVDGDDGAEFMQAFATRFDVDLAAFQFGQHFGPEVSCSPVRLVWYLLSSGNRPKFVPITLADLAEAVREGRWLASPAGLAAASQSAQCRKGADD